MAEVEGIPSQLKNNIIFTLISGLFLLSPHILQDKFKKTEIINELINLIN